MDPRTSWGWIWGRRLATSQSIRSCSSAPMDAGDLFFLQFHPPLTAVGVAHVGVVSAQLSKTHALPCLDQPTRHGDGREWRVELQEKEVSGVVSSCGDEPKTSKAWHAVGVHAGNVSGA